MTVNLLPVNVEQVSAEPVNAEQACQITDPAGAPLNIRDQPDGEIIHTLRNGQQIYIHEQAYGAQNQPWVKIGSFYSGGYRIWGWIAQKFVSCGDR